VTKLRSSPSKRIAESKSISASSATSRSSCSSTRRDHTSGCTIECKEFRDALPKFEGKAHVFGISHDDRASHEAFRDALRLNFPLLSDPGGAVAERFSVWEQTQWGPQNKRTTFIIRGKRIVRVFENVEPQGHADEVLAAVSPQSTGRA